MSGSRERRSTLKWSGGSWIIVDDLQCDAVRISGGDPARLSVAGEAAAEAGLRVWFSPFPTDLNQAERLCWDGADVVLITGCELSMFASGFIRPRPPGAGASLPGGGSGHREQRLMVLPNLKGASYDPSSFHREYPNSKLLVDCTLRSDLSEEQRASFEEARSRGSDEIDLAGSTSARGTGPASCSVGP